MTRTRGRALHGLDWLTAFCVVATLNRARHGDGVCVCELLSPFARRMSSPLLGGCAGAAIDNSFEFALRELPEGTS